MEMMSCEQRARAGVCVKKAQSFERLAKIVICVMGIILVISGIVFIAGLVSRSMPIADAGIVIGLMAGIAMLVCVSLYVASNSYYDEAKRIKRDFWQEQCPTYGIFNEDGSLLIWLKRQLGNRSH